ncbi:protein kinase [Kribbella sp. VKM Ac-2500]|uniref:protein kinase domain-containing protein n=2 Tax=Kribbella TaxID=182639 RepID=UPI0013050DFE|nr:protein kinase [Kribbella sp. VKM Ac-2500]
MALEDIAGYSLRRGLGSGSVGAVWLVRDLASGRHAVLKRIPKSAVPSPNDFRDDLARARGIDHPHVARLLEVRQTDREWLLFSQYVAAGTLTALLQRRGPLSLDELVTLISPLAQGLAAMHRADLTHTRLSSDNIMFDADGRPVLTDPGLRMTSQNTPADDLKALGALALHSGADPKLFPSTLFITPGDDIAQHLLSLTPPTPIDLGFTPTTPHPATTTPESTAQATAAPATASPETTGPATTNPESTSLGSIGSGSTRTGTAGRRLAGLRSPGLGSARAGLTGSGRDRGVVGRGGVDGPGTTMGRVVRGVTRGGSSRRTRAARVRSTGTMGAHRDGSVARVREGLLARRSAYGILAACGVAALIVLGIGLATVGVLGQPATGSTTTAGTQQSSSATSPGESASPGPVTTAGKPGEPPGNSTRAAEDSKRWLQTLQSLDRRRSQAFSTLNPAGLDAIYVPGSPPWSSDRSLLASYRKQQVRVEGLRMQIETLVVEHPGDETVVLRIVDRLIAGAAVTGSGQRTPLPAGSPTTRRITLTATNTSWRISAITTT